MSEFNNLSLNHAVLNVNFPLIMQIFYSRSLTLQPNYLMHVANQVISNWSYSNDHSGWNQLQTTRSARISGFAKYSDCESRCAAIRPYCRCKIFQPKSIRNAA